MEFTQTTESEYIFACPFGNHSTDSAKLYMNAETTAWICHKCNEKGNAIHFAKRLLDISMLETIRFLKARYSPAGIDPASRDMVAEVKAIRNQLEPEVSRNTILPHELVEQYEVDWSAVAEADEIPASLAYMGERGFALETLDYWQIGYDSMTDRIVLPIFDEREQLVGFKGRAWRSDHQPKYLVMGDRRGRAARFGYPCYQKSLVLFGLHEAIYYIETLDKDQPAHLIVCEGELNAIALWQAGYRNAVAVNGSELSSRQERLLKQYADTVTIFFDSDDAGDTGTLQVANALSSVMPVKVVPDHEGDPASMSTEEIDKVLQEAVSFSVLQCGRVRVA